MTDPSPYGVLAIAQALEADIESLRAVVDLIPDTLGPRATRADVVIGVLEDDETWQDAAQVLVDLNLYDLDELERARKRCQPKQSNESHDGPMTSKTPSPTEE